MHMDVDKMFTKINSKCNLYQDSVHSLFRLGVVDDVVNERAGGGDVHGALGEPHIHRGWVFPLVCGPHTLVHEHSTLHVPPEYE